MKKSIFTLFAAFCFFSLSALDTSISYCTFKAGDKQYIEVSIFVVGNTVTFLPIDSDSLQKQAAVEILILLKQNEEIKSFEKYILNSPISEINSDFLDLKRFVLEAGDYELEVSVKDVNKEGNDKLIKESISINFSGEGLQQSDIQLLSSFKKQESNNIFVKSGYQLEPLSFNFYNKRANRLMFYNEIYNADKAMGEDFLVSYTITEVISEGLKNKPISIGHKRKKPESTNALLIQMDITDLKSGNYELAVEVRSRQNKLLSRKTTKFQRSNPYLNIDSKPITKESLAGEFVQEMNKEQLTYALRAIAVILNDQDGEHLNRLLREENSDAQKIYLFSYWAQQNPVKPYDAYIEYMKVARAVDDKFDSGFGYGFETDRGYVYMKYGQPSDMLSESNDPSAPPYEIWSYNQALSTNQGNVKFIFYNPSLSPGNYILLHSTARGEVNNPNWQREMYRDVPGTNGGRDINSSSGFGNGRNAERNWTDFD